MTAETGARQLQRLHSPGLAQATIERSPSAVIGFNNSDSKTLCVGTIGIHDKAQQTLNTKG